MIMVNGKPVENAVGLNVTELLALVDLPQNRVAVESNGEIIPKKDYESHRFQDGDTVEVVQFVGGG